MRAKWHGLFFPIICVFTLCGIGLCQEPLALDKIVISRNKTLQFSGLPLDLQSRSPRGQIQSDFSLRGSDFQGVLLLLDGRGINDPQTGHYNGDIPLTKEDIENIELLPSIDAPRLGLGSIGGAINILRKVPSERRKVWESVIGQHRSLSGLLSFSERKDNLGFRVSLENQESAGFREDTDFKKFTGSLSCAVDLPEGSFHLDAGYQEKEFGAYDFYTPNSGYLSKEWTKVYLLDTGLNLEENGLIIKPAFLWRRHYDKFLLDKTLLRSLYLNHHRTDIYTPLIYFQKEITHLGRLGLGLEYGQERITSTSLGKHERNRKSLALDDYKDLNEKLSLQFCGRYDTFEGFDNLGTGAFWLRYRVSAEYAFRLGIARNARIPTFTELYYNDPTTVGNADLSVEKALGPEFGVDYQKERLSWGLTAFLRREKDAIDWIKRTHSQAKWEALNLCAADVFGLESSLKYRLNNKIAVNSHYTYVDKRADDDTYIYKYGPNYSRHLAQATLTFDSPVGEQALTFTYKKKPRRDGWLLADSRLSFRLSKEAQIFCHTSNLFNVEYQEIEGVPQPGRWMEVGMRVAW